MEHAVAEAINDMQEQPQPAEPVQLRGRPATIGEQMSVLQRAEYDLLNRIRREMVDAKAAADRTISDAHSDFERGLSEETARLSRQRDDAILEAQDACHQRLHELTALLRRRP
jgi:23S rRNA maturation-related 3'-5' exoribonuclease YhaM